MNDNAEIVQNETPPTEEHAENPQLAENSEQNGEKKEDPPAKKDTPEEIERRKLRHAYERQLRKNGELKARLEALSQQRENFTRDQSRATNPSESHSDNETLQLSRAEIQQLIEQEARKLAPSITQQAEIERQRSAVVEGLAKDWGREKFDTLSASLEDAFDGLTANGRPKPAVDAIFESDSPRALIEYLADPDHADEAEAISRMSATAAARAITKLEAKLAAEKAKDKPQPSKAGAPIEPLKGQGDANRKSLFDLSDAEFMKRRREQVARRR
jgi:hypothetical protein